MVIKTVVIICHYVQALFMQVLRNNLLLIIQAHLIYTYSCWSQFFVYKVLCCWLFTRYFYKVPLQGTKGVSKMSLFCRESYSVYCRDRSFITAFFCSNSFITAFFALINSVTFGWERVWLVATFIFLHLLQLYNSLPTVLTSFCSTTPV